MASSSSSWEECKHCSYKKEKPQEQCKKCGSMTPASSYHLWFDGSIETSDSVPFLKKQKSGTCFPPLSISSNHVASCDSEPFLNQKKDDETSSWICGVCNLLNHQNLRCTGCDTLSSRASFDSGLDSNNHDSVGLEVTNGAVKEKKVSLTFLIPGGIGKLSNVVHETIKSFDGVSIRMLDDQITFEAFEVLSSGDSCVQSAANHLLLYLCDRPQKTGLKRLVGANYLVRILIEEDGFLARLPPPTWGVETEILNDKDRKFLQISGSLEVVRSSLNQC